MKGTEKQINWATSLIEKADQVIAKEIKSNVFYRKGDFIISTMQIVAKWEELKQTQTAGWFIDLLKGGELNYVMGNVADICTKDFATDEDADNFIFDNGVAIYTFAKENGTSEATIRSEISRFLNDFHEAIEACDAVFMPQVEEVETQAEEAVVETQVEEVVEVETQAKEVKIFTKATGEYAYSIWFTNDFNEIYSSKEDCRLNKENCKDDFFFHCFKNGQYIKSIDGDCGFACPKREMQKFDIISEHGPDCDMVFLKKYNDSEIEKYLNNNLDDDYCLESDLVVETQEVEVVEVETQNNVEVVETEDSDSDMTQDRVNQDTDQLYFPTIQAFLEATDNIEETDNGDLVFTTKGTKYICTDKNICKKYSANNMFVGNYVFDENIDVVVGQETYPMIEILEARMNNTLEQSFAKHQEALQEIKDFFGINRTTIHEICWCEEIRKASLPYGGVAYKYKKKDKLEFIGLSEDYIIFEKGDYTAITHSDYDEPVILYITKNFLD